MPKRRDNRKIRFAVVGLGHIAQAAVLPAFRNVENAELSTLISGDPEKAAAVAAHYDGASTFTYEEHPACLARAGIDAVNIATPNDRHRDFAVAAAHARVHVLCETPLAVTQERQMRRSGEVAILSTQQGTCRTGAGDPQTARRGAGTGGRASTGARRVTSYCGLLDRHLHAAARRHAALAG